MNAPVATTTYSANEIMTIVAARNLRDTDVCFVGIGAPSAACNVARLTHAPNIVLIYESGTIETKPKVLPLSIGDGELCETALCTVPVPEMPSLMSASMSLPARSSSSCPRQRKASSTSSISSPRSAMARAGRTVARAMA